MVLVIIWDPILCQVILFWVLSFWPRLFREKGSKMF